MRSVLMLAVAISLAWLFSGTNSAPVAVGNPPDFTIEHAKPICIGCGGDCDLCESCDCAVIKPASDIVCTPFGCGPAMRQMGGSPVSGVVDGEFVRGQPVRNVLRATAGVLNRLRPRNWR